MSSTTTTADNATPVFYDEGSHHPQQGTLFGFWMYLMSDCLIFAILFATYAVLGRSYAAGPSGADLFELPTVALNTTFLLLSSITYGFAMIQMLGGKKTGVLVWLAITGVLGLCFLTVEINEFVRDRSISWTVLGQLRPQIGHIYGFELTPAVDAASTVVTSFYDWSKIDPKWRDAGIFPVLSEGALRATLGILDRTVRRGYPRR